MLESNKLEDARTTSAAFRAEQGQLREARSTNPLMQLAKKCLNIASHRKFTLGPA